MISANKTDQNMDVANNSTGSLRDTSFAPHDAENHSPNVLQGSPEVVQGVVQSYPNTLPDVTAHLDVVLRGQEDIAATQQKIHDQLALLQSCTEDVESFEKTQETLFNSIAGLSDSFEEVKNAVQDIRTEMEEKNKIIQRMQVERDESDQEVYNLRPGMEAMSQDVLALSSGMEEIRKSIQEMKTEMRNANMNVPRTETGVAVVDDEQGMKLGLSCTMGTAGEGDKDALTVRGDMQAVLFDVQELREMLRCLSNAKSTESVEGRELLNDPFWKQSEMMTNYQYQTSRDASLSEDSGILSTCGKVFENYSGLRVHVQCNETVEQASYYRADQTPGGSQDNAEVLCPCGKVCENETGLKIHQSNSQCGAKSVANQYSNADIGDTASLTRGTHYSTDHSQCRSQDVFEVVCPCGKVCKNERGLKIHQSKSQCGSTGMANHSNTAHFQDMGTSAESYCYGTGQSPSWSQGMSQVVCPCGKVCKNERGLRIHQGKSQCRLTGKIGAPANDHSPVQYATSCVDDCTDGVIQDPGRPSTPTQVSCTCGKVCKNERGLKIHQGKSQCSKMMEKQTPAIGVDGIGSQRSTGYHQDSASARQNSQRGAGQGPSRPQEAGEVVCPHCGKVCKNLRGLKIHQGKAQCSKLLL